MRKTTRAQLLKRRFTCKRNELFSAYIKYKSAPSAVKMLGKNHEISFAFFRKRGFHCILENFTPDKITPSVGTNIITAIIICVTGFFSK